MSTMETQNRQRATAGVSTTERVVILGAAGLSLAVFLTLGVVGYGVASRMGAATPSLSGGTYHTGPVVMDVRPSPDAVPPHLVLDVQEAESAGPGDVWNSFSRVAATFAQGERRFQRVDLSYQGRVVFVLAGDDFDAVGREALAGKNPSEGNGLARRLRTPDGSPAYPDSAYRGGFTQWDDAALRWATGGEIVLIESEPAGR